jgi:hypothetical protein
LSVSLDPVSIVKFTRAIDTQPDKKAVLFEEATPVIRKQGAVGLNGIGDLFAPGIFSLQRDYRPEIVNAQQSGLAALPGKLDFRYVLALNVLADDAFKDFRGHPKWGWTTVQVFLFRVKAIGARQVTRCPGRLDHQLKMHAISSASRA